MALEEIWQVTNSFIGTVKLSPLKTAAVPPPMSLCDISLKFNAIDVAFSKSSSKIAVLTPEGVSIYNWGSKTESTLDTKLHLYPSSHPSERGRQVAFLDESHVYVLKQCDPAVGMIERISLITNERKPVFESEEAEHLSSIFSNLEQNSLWVAQGTRQKKGLSYSIVSDDENETLPVTPWTESPGQDSGWGLATQLADGDVRLNCLSSPENLADIHQHILFSLTRSGALYANKRLLAKNCTSFILTAAHLIFTTTQHLLKFVHLTTVDGMYIPCQSCNFLAAD